MSKALILSRPQDGLFFRLTLAALLLASLLFWLPRSASAEQDAFASVSGGSGKTSEAKASDSQGQIVVQSVEAILASLADPTAASPKAALETLADITQAQGPAERDLPSMSGARGVALRDTVKSPLSRILQYAYNPEVPAYLVLPSVVRVSHWYPGSDILNLATPLYEQLPAPAEPLILRGREYEEITPDTNSGGYYQYNLKRMLALFQHEGRNVLVSVSRQDGESEVGKKGVVLDDAKWNYFYSGEDGLTTGGIGWMDTYMYDSWSVAVFVEQPDGTTTNMVFKWLRAGWAGMNVVQASHIMGGCKRFALAFRSVIESSLLPAASQLADKARELMALSEGELDRRIKDYSRELERLWKDHPTLSRRSFAAIVKDGGYAKTMNHEERVGTLLLEYLKSQILGPSIRQG